MNKTSTKWALFGALMFTAPVPYFMFVVAGLLPLSAITYSSLSGPFGLVVFNGIHVLFFAPLLYLLARSIARWLDTFEDPARKVYFVLAISVIVALAFLPIYGAGHNGYTPNNLFELFAGGLGNQ